MFQRFISEDPLGLAGGINVYAYAENDPIDLTDTLGLKVINRSKITVYVKPEVGKEPAPLPSGGTYPGPQDGVAVPCYHPNKVYKSVNDTDVLVTPSGDVLTFGGSIKQRLGQLAGPFDNRGGGWKGRSWLEWLHSHGDYDWDPLFERSLIPSDTGGRYSCPRTIYP